MKNAGVTSTPLIPGHFDPAPQVGLGQDDTVSWRRCARRLAGSAIGKLADPLQQFQI